MRRRTFFLSAAALALAAAVGALARLLARPQAPRTRAFAAPEGIVPRGDEALLRQIASVLVPAYAGHPAAGEIDLLPRLERWVQSSPRRLDGYRKGWPRFAEAVRGELREPGGSAEAERLAALLARGHDAHRRGEAGALPRFFEQLRRDVLRVYYASPEGWAFVGYAGPPMRHAPPGGPGT